MTRPGFSSSTIFFKIFATVSGSTVPSTFTWMPRSAPIARPVRIVSAACAAPIDTHTISVALPPSFRRSASSTAISSKGFIAILTLARSTPEPSGFTRTFTFASTTRFTGTNTFIPASLAIEDVLEKGLELQRAGTVWPDLLAVNALGPTFQRLGIMILQEPVGVAIEQLHAGPAHEHDEKRAGHEPADMRPPGDFLVGAGEDVDKLQHNPEADHPFGRELE